MLVLGRRVGETICIGQDIRVMVLEIRGQHVNIGVTAPPEVAVHREEIYNRVRRGEQKKRGRR